MRVEDVQGRNAGVLRFAQDDDVSTANANKAAADKKLVDGAQEFEAMLLGQMLKGLAFGGAPGEDAEDADAGAAGTVRSFGTEAVAKAVAAGGGFGLARQIVRQVGAERDATKGVVAEDQGGTKVR